MTGNGISNIDGSIRANGSANVFLINPNGIVFGETATLDLGGSFVGTTAQSIVFEDGSQFVTRNAQRSSLLTVSVPEGLVFDQTTPASIINRSSASPEGAVNALEAILGSGPAPVGLRVDPGQTLALVGGDVMLEGGNLTAPGGRIELGSVGSNSTVNFTSDDFGWAFEYDEVDNFSDIDLSSFALIDTSDFMPLVDGTNGPITLTGGNISLREGSQIFAFNFGAQSDPPILPTPSINISATDSVTLDGFDANSNELSSIYTLSVNTAAAGDINLRAENLNISQFANFGSATVGPGNTGSVNVIVEDRINIPDGIGIFTQVVPEATGNAQQLSLRARELVAQNGAQISSSTFGRGDAGEVRVVVTDLIRLSGSDGGLPTSIASAVVVGGSGNAGQTTIETRQLEVLEGAQIANTVLGSGQGSDIEITATEYVLLSGTTPNATLLLGSSGIFVAADPAFPAPDTGNVIPTTGTSGNLILTTPRLTVENGARISADTFGTGPGGNTTLNVGKLFVLNGGQIRAGSLVEEGAASNERGPGGTLIANASNLIEISGIGSIGETVVPSALLVSAEGTGPAGNIDINQTSDNLRIFVNDGDIRTDAVQSAGGRININGDTIILTGDGDIRTNVASGADNGGDIFIVGNSLVALDDSDILAFAQDGAGGDITLPAFFRQTSGTTESDVIESDGTADRFDGNNRVDVDASGQLASGTITFPDVSFIEDSLSELPDAPIDTDTLVASSCIAPIAQGSGRLVLTGADGISRQPGNTGIATVPTGAIRTLTEETAAAAPEEQTEWQIGDPITEPQSLYQLASGRLVLSRDCS